MMTLSRVFLFCCCCLFVSKSFLVSCAFSSPSTDSLTTLESNESVISRFEECKLVFERHQKSSNLQVEESLGSIAISFAAGLTTHFEFDASLSVPCHCFLLSYFLTVNEDVYEAGRESSYYSEFIRVYSERLAAKVASLQNPAVIHLHVIPLIHDLALTGNFLHYSILLSVYIDKFTELEKDLLYVAHGTQFAFRTDSNFEVFKMGIEFLQLYAPRYDVLSISGIGNMEAFASKHPEAFYFLAFNPLKAALSSKSAFEGIIRPLIVYDNDQCLRYLNTFLLETGYASTYTNSSNRKHVFNALLKNFLTVSNIFASVKMNLFFVFQTWVLFQWTLIDQRTLLQLRKACYESLDPRFRESFDSLFSLNPSDLGRLF